MILSDIVPHEYKFSGKRISDKIVDLRREIRKLNGASLLVNALDDVACKRVKFCLKNYVHFTYTANIFLFSGLLNLRGQDIADYNPVIYAYVIVTHDDIYLYVLDKSRITSKIYKHFKDEGVEVIVDEYDKITNGINKVVSI